MKLVVMLSATISLMAQTYTFSDGGKQTRLEFAPNEAYLTVVPGADRKAAIATVKKTLGSTAKSTAEAGEAGFVLTLSKPARETVKALRTGKSRVEGLDSAAPVFYDSGEKPAARRESARRIMTNRLLVRIDSDARWDALRESTHAQNRKDSLIKGWSLMGYADPYTALDAVDSLTQAGGWEFSPVFARQFKARQAASGPLKRPVNDPLFPNQWHLTNDGPGIRMNASWDIATGKGINVTVVDDGLDVAHEDLAGNAYPLSSGNHRNFNGGPPNDPTPAKPDQNHGTNCAGLIAAVGFNNIGVIGVAPEARLMGLRLIAEPAPDDATGDALSWQPNGLVTHVSSNSWGPPDDGMSLGRIGSLQAAAIELAATNYRNGLGTVFAVSAGNGRQSGDDASYDAFSASRFVIGVGAVNRNGEPSSFSEQGINVAISALGGEFNPPDVLWTTNNSGPAALDSLKSKFETSQAPINYSDAFNGTSAAAPQVSGAAALLLQVNSNLGYRDVKEILMRTATKTGLTGGDDFRDNGGGFSFSHSFGAGLLNVSAALDLAAGWTNLGPLTSVSASSPDTKAIPDGSLDGATFSLDFSSARNLRVESVEVTVNVEHANRGDIGFIITSPSGMVSIVNNRPPDDGANFEDYVLTSVRHWGESSAGFWKVKVIDAQANGITGRAGDISMRIYGTAK
jgi:subtilisin family serine protease